jgi:hypothetical protein
MATVAGSEAVLPAYLVGMALAPAFLADPELPHRRRIIAFTILTPPHISAPAGQRKNSFEVPRAAPSVSIARTCRKPAFAPLRNGPSSLGRCRV